MSTDSSLGQDEHPEDSTEKGQILETFELEGKEAKVIKVSPDYIMDSSRLDEFASGLTESNFESDGSNDEQERMARRDKIEATRRRIAKLPILGKRLSESPHWEKRKAAAYSDYTVTEHNEGNRLRIKKMIKDNEVLVIEVEGEPVAIQGVGPFGDGTIYEGRPVYQFTKASTLKGYRRKGLSTKLKKTGYESINQERAQKGEIPAFWLTCSRNGKVEPATGHIGTFKKWGWDISPLEDETEHGKYMKGQCGDYWETMKKHEYLMMYFDPSKGTPNW